MRTIKTIIKDTKKKAFTLIELLIVVAIIGILAGVGIPMYNGYMTSARIASTESNHSSIASFIAGTVTRCATGAATVRLGNREIQCTTRGVRRSAQNWSTDFVTYFNAINTNPWNPDLAATVRSGNTRPGRGITHIFNNGTAIIRIRTNIGNDATPTANVFLPDRRSWLEIRIE